MNIPQKTHIDLEYCCEFCNFSIWITAPQSQAGFIICPYCDKKFFIRPYSKKKEEVPFVNPNVPDSSINFKYIKSILAGMGIDKRICTDIINKVRLNNPADTDSFLKECLSILNEY